MNKLVKIILEDCKISYKDFTVELSKEKERIFVDSEENKYVIRIWDQHINNKGRIIARYTLFGSDFSKSGIIIKKKKELLQNINLM